MKKKKKTEKEKERKCKFLVLALNRRLSLFCEVMSFFVILPVLDRLYAPLKGVVNC